MRTVVFKMLEMNPQCSNIAIFTNEIDGQLNRLEQANGLEKSTFLNMFDVQRISKNDGPPPLELPCAAQVPTARATPPRAQA